jgi:hypothetical protein
MMYAVIVIFTFGMPVSDTNLLGEPVQRPMQPTMMAFTTATTQEKCEEVLQRQEKRIVSTFKAKGAQTLNVQQHACQSAQETEIYLEAMHAVPVETSQATRSYILPI